MSALIIETLIEYWPVIVTALCGLCSAVVTYLIAKTKARTKEAELEAVNVELQKTMIEGSYILCPSCGSKIYLKDAKVYVGGKTYENETKTQ